MRAAEHGWQERDHLDPSTLRLVHQSQYADQEDPLVLSSQALKSAKQI
jgi:hypothetical protein